MFKGRAFEDLSDGSSKSSLFGRLWSCGALGASLSGSRGLGRGADGRFTDEDGTGLDRESFGADVTNHLGAGLEFDAFGCGEIAVDLAVNDDGSGFDFGADASVFADREIAVRGDFAFDFSVNDEIVGELYRALDFHVGGKDVARGGGRWARGSSSGGLL